MEYLEHLVEHTSASLEKPWKMLLLDNHITPLYPEFIIKAAKFHIVVFSYPSHLTHALQPLDVGVFRPWKHYHNQAIQHAIWSLDFEYTLTSFFRDLLAIREKTMKYHTIVNAFHDSEMWPISCAQGLKKMRSYRRKRKTLHNEED
jgi:hypothetical protein